VFRQLGTERASEGNKGQAATNLKATRGRHRECAPERRDDESAKAHSK
jgi:hypothetical protein